MSGLDMIGPVSKRGDKAFGLAELIPQEETSKALNLGKLKLVSTGKKKPLPTVEPTQRLLRSTGANLERFNANRVGKVDTTMSDSDANRLAAHYDTRGPLPKKLSRPARMRAYEARYIASGGKKGERWQHRANTAEVGRNIGLAGATVGAATTLAARGKKFGPALRKAKITPHRADNATIGAAAFGGASELYGEYARKKRASFRNSPAGVAGSALSRMQAYTPEKKKP